MFLQDTDYVRDVIDRDEYDNPFARQPKFIKFDRLPKTTLGEAYVNQIKKSADLHIERKARQRKPQDQQIYEQQVAAIACELACHVLQNDERGLLYNRSNGKLGRRDGSTPSFVTKKLKTVVDALVEAGLVDQTLGYKVRAAKRGVATAIYPTDALTAFIIENDLKLSDFTKHTLTEPIVLKAAKTADGNKVLRIADTPETLRFKQEMDDINAWIGEADLGFDMAFAGIRPVDPSSKYLQRIFTCGDLKFHGRMYGGFWIGLTKDQRTQGLTINGEKVVCLDYSQMILRTAYSYAGVPLPSGNLYAIPGYDHARQRDGVKAVTSSLFFRATPMKRLPDKARVLLPGVNAASIKLAIMRHHQGISHLMDTTIGHELVRKESDLLVKVLGRLRQLGIVALPIHDSVVVPQSAELTAIQVMETTGQELLGVPCPVKREDGDQGQDRNLIVHSPTVSNTVSPGYA